MNLTREQFLGLAEVTHPVFGPDRAVVGPRAHRDLAAARADHARFEVPFGFEVAGYERSLERVRAAREVADMYHEYGAG